MLKKKQQGGKNNEDKIEKNSDKNKWNRWGCKRERESNRLEKIALNCNAKKWKKYIISKDRYAWIFISKS